MKLAATLTLVAASLAASMTSAADWPQWMGPGRDDVWRESGVVTSIPADGLPVKWRADVGLGYAGPAVADGRVFVADYVKTAGRITNQPGSADTLEGEERLVCLDANTGEELWTHAESRRYELSFPGGPRCTPTVDGDRVYTLGAMGHLRCLNVENGDVLWGKSFSDDYGAKIPIWGCAAHPLVHGDLLYCVVGGKGSVAVAFDKRTGEEVWRALSANEPGYCPPTLIEHGGKQQLLIWSSDALNALDPQTGKVFWSVPIKPSYGMAIAPPLKSGDHLFVSAYNNVSALLKLPAGGGEPEIVWKGTPKTSVYCANSPGYVEDGIVYGMDVQSSNLIAVRLETGKRIWESDEPVRVGDRARYGTAYLVRHHPAGQDTDRVFLFTEKGDLKLARITPDGYREQGRFHVLEPTNSAFRRQVLWSHPAFAGRCLFARNDEEVVCVDLSR